MTSGGFVTNVGSYGNNALGKAQPYDKLAYMVATTSTGRKAISCTIGTEKEITIKGAKNLFTFNWCLAPNKTTDDLVAGSFRIVTDPTAPEMVALYPSATETNRKMGAYVAVVTGYTGNVADTVDCYAADEKVAVSLTHPGSANQKLGSFAVSLSNEGTAYITDANSVTITATAETFKDTDGLAYTKDTPSVTYTVWTAPSSGDPVNVTTGHGFTVSDNTISVTKDAVAGSYKVKGTSGTVTAEATLAVEKDPAALTSVELDKRSVTVTGAGEAQTVTATAKDQYGAAMTQGVTWTLVGNSDSQVTIAGNVVSVANKAAEATVSVKAATSGVTNLDPATFTITRTDASKTTVTNFSIGTISAVEVPTGDDVTVDVKALITGVKNIYNETKTLEGKAITWSVKQGEATDANVTITSDGVLHVKKEAKATIQNTTGLEFTVSATIDNVTKTQTVQVKRAISEVTTVEVTGASAITVPDNSEADVTQTYTAAVKDQYGATMDSQSITWTLTGGNENVTIDSGTGVLTVKKCAAAAPSATVKATCGTVSAEFPVAVTRAASEVTTVEVTGANAITVPANNAQSDLTQPYTATVKDQYGATMSDQTVTWTLTGGNDNVFIGVNDGELVVRKGAAAAPNAKIKATVGSVSSAEFAVAVTRAASVVTSIVINDTPAPTVVRPTSGGPNTATYTFTVKDQYGSPISGKTATWSTTGTVTNVTVALPQSQPSTDGATVSVPTNASTGELTLTVTSSDKNDATASITVKVVDIAFELTANGANGKKDLVKDNESSFLTIKSNPTYGDTWASIVTVNSGNIVAKVGEDPVTSIGYAVVDGGNAATLKPGASASNAETDYKSFKIVVVDNDDYNGTVVYEGKVYVAKANADCTAPTAVANLTYTGAEQVLIAAGSTNDGTMKYAISATDAAPDAADAAWKTDVADIKGTAAKSYFVWYMVAGDSNHNNTEPAKVNNVSIGQATITGYNVAEENINVTILANDTTNNTAARLTGTEAGSVYAQLGSEHGTVNVKFGDNKTAALAIDWANTTTTYNAKSATYTYQGSVAGATGNGTNFQSYNTKLVFTVNVKPVNVTGFKTSDGSDFATVTLKASDILAANTAGTNLATLLPGNIQVTFDNEVATKENVTPKWNDTDLANLVTQANAAIVAEDDKALTVRMLATTVTDEWATLDNAKLITLNVTITPKEVINDKVTFNPVTVVYDGEAVEASDFTAAIAVDQTDLTIETGDELTQKLTYNGSETLPTNAGEYTIKLVVENSKYKGVKEATLTINKKSISVTAEDKERNYKESNPALTWTIADGQLCGNDQKTALTVTLKTTATVSSGAGKYAITQDAEPTAANYSITVVDGKLIVKPLDLSEKTVTITGTAKAGNVLSTSIAGVDSPEAQVTWQWGTTTDGTDFTAISGATSVSYTLTDNEAGKNVTVKATGSAGATAPTSEPTTVTNQNYYGMATATAVEVSKLALTGTLKIAKTNGTGVDGKIDEGDVLKADITGLNATEGTYVWTVGGETVDVVAATGYTVQAADAGKVIKVVFTAGGNVEGTAEASVVVGLTVMPDSGWSVQKNDSDVSAAAVGDTLAIKDTNSVNPDAYTIQWLADGQPIANATAGTYEVTADDQGKTISVVVSAVTGEGATHTGSVAFGAVKVPAAAPDAPVASASGSDGKVTVSWRAPATHGVPIIGYTVAMTAPSSTSVTVSAATTSYTFEDLENGTEYSFTVTALAKDGSSDLNSAASEVVKATPAAPVYIPSGGSSKPTTETTTNEDGSVTTTVTDKDGNVTETTVATDGTETIVETKKDGTVTETVKATDGTESSVETKTDGTVTETVKTTDGTVSSLETKPDGSATATVTQANGVKAEAETTTKGETTATVTVPETVDTAKVTIPMKETTPGTVAIIVHEDGTEEVLRDSVALDKGVVVQLDESATLKIVDNSKDFVDVKKDDWAKGSIDFVSAREIFKGTSDTTFSPKTQMTRAMMATALFRLDGELKTADAHQFSDVADNTYYTDGVAWAHTKGIVKGNEKGTFDPDNNITREQLFTMVYNYAKTRGMGFTGLWMMSPETLNFSDKDSISDYAYEAVCWFSMNGLINGKPGNILDPKGFATRAEVAAMLEHFVSFAAK